MRCLKNYDIAYHKKILKMTKISTLELNKSNDSEKNSTHPIELNQFKPPSTRNSILKKKYLHKRLFIECFTNNICERWF